MEDIFGMIFTRITHINFEEITEFMNTTNYTIEQYNVLKEKVKLAKDSINSYKRSCTDDSKILLVICNAAEDIINTLDDYLCSQESCIVKHEENCKQIKYNMPNIEEAAILYYVMYGHKEYECTNLTELIEHMDSEEVKLDFSIKGIINNSKDSSIYFEKIQGVMEDYYCNRKSEHSLSDVIELLVSWGKVGINLDDEILLLNNCRELESKIVVLVIINLLERINNKISKYRWTRATWRMEDAICADDAALAIIAITCLRSSYKKIDKVNCIPNRNIIVHESVLVYEDVDKMKDILVDMMYYIINLRLHQK